MSERVSKDAMACNKPRRTPGHPKKSHVVKACYDGKEKIIRFGEQGASTAGKPKEGESERMKTKRASFKARHAKNIAKGKSSAAYWADRVKWNEGGMVKMAAGGSAALALIEQMRRSGAQSQEFDPVLVAMREQRARPARRSVMPQAAPRMPEPQAEALPLPPVPPAMRPDENPPPEAPRSPLRFDEGNPHVATAIRMAEKYGLPSNIFLSLVQQESRFDPNARSRRGAIGLGQLMPGTARELGVDPTDPVQNLEGSARYLRQMLDRFGDMSLALAAYNAGPGRVARAGNTIPNIRETQQYVPSILRRAGVSMPEGFAEGGLAELEQKYAEGGRVGRVAGAIRRAATRRAEKPAETYPRAEVTPSFKVEPEPGQSFENWIDSLYSPEVRGPDNITRHPSLMYRGVSDAELEAAIQNRAFRPLSDPALFVENDPSRYLGGGAYGARNAGAIVQFDVGGLPSVRQSSQRVRDLVEDAVPEIPTERVTRIWRWDPERRGHYLMSSDEMNEFLRRNTAGLADLADKYAEGGAVMSDEEYDRRLLSRMKEQTGRVTEPTRAEQMQALRTAGRSAAEGVADVLLPQSPLDVALMVALGPGGRAARLAGAGALAALEPSEAEASRLRRLIRAYHGSPHKFDEFDIRKIGTGEGAQAYGRGLYFAENEDVARAYKRNLAGGLVDREGNSVRLPDNREARSAYELLRNHGDDYDKTISMLRGYRDRASGPLRSEQDEVLDWLDVWRGSGVRPAGHMYEVDLNASPRDFLNWDVPLSRQTREVQESLQRFGLRADPDAARAYDDALLDALYNDASRPLPPLPRDPTGQEIYERALRMDPEEARIALMEVGIPGTRYFDAGSRGVGGGTYNYAVFDPDIIDIVRRYAKGGLAELEKKYAEGGEVSVMSYDPDAVDALVKEIEAEYV